MADEIFITIEQHWAHFLELDIPPEAPPEQAREMKRAFAAGAISGLQLAVVAMRDKPREDATASLKAHIAGITALVRSGKGSAKT